MGQHLSKRKSIQLLAAAASSAAAAFAACPSRTDAALFVDLKALAASGSGNTVTPKLVTVAGAGVTVTLGVYARITGNNATQTTGDYDLNADAPDTRNDDSLDILSGSFNSFGPLLGDMNPLAGVSLSYESRVAPFLNSGSARGAAADWDSDGDL